MENLESVPRSERMKIINKNSDKKNKEFRELERKFETCKKCWMVTYTGSVWYCPLPYCERENDWRL